MVVGDFPDRQVPHKPEYYDRIIWYVGKYAKMMKVEILEAFNSLLSGIYLVFTPFLCRLLACAQFIFVRIQY